MKIGMVGLDTSHCVAFTRLLNDPQDEYHIPGARVVAAYPGGSETFSLSRDRVSGFTETLATEYGVEMYDAIEDLAASVDAILLESVDGRQHLEQFARLAVGKPVFIDKPFTTSVEEARELAGLAAHTGTPVMSCSSLRYAAGIGGILASGEAVESCEAFGRAVLLDDYPGLFWYGVHSAEVLFSFMGTGCKRVRCTAFPSMDIVTGEWHDGRVGIMRGTRLQYGDFGCILHTDAGMKVGLARSVPPYYQLMLKEVVEFFGTGISPIPIEETVGITAFLEAAEISRERGGEVVALDY